MCWNTRLRELIKIGNFLLFQGLDRPYLLHHALFHTCTDSSLCTPAHIQCVPLQVLYPSPQLASLEALTSHLSPPPPAPTPALSFLTPEPSLPASSGISRLELSGDPFLLKGRKKEKGRKTRKKEESRRMKLDRRGSGALSHLTALQ